MLPNTKYITHVHEHQYTFHFKQADSFIRSEQSFSSPKHFLSLLITKKHHCVHKIPPLIKTLRQMNTTCTLMNCFVKIHFNIIFPRTATSIKRNCVSALPGTSLYPPSRRATRSAHILLLNFVSIIIIIIIIIIIREE